MRLKGKVALVTGSATGIGKAIALAYAREGAAVVVNYSRSRVEAEETLGEITGAGGQAILVQADVADEGQVRRMVERTVERFKRIDILVNNAGTTRFIAMDDLDAVDDEAWDAIFAVNVKGTFYCSRAVVPIMRAQGEGSIINISSIAGFIGQGSSIPYVVSKAGVIALTKSLSRVLGPEIRVNGIAPGFVPTRWNEGREYLYEEIIKDTPMGRLAAPEDVAGVAVALVTDASFLTGQTIIVDGGKIVPR